ncbi:MAG: MFS transporter [Puniceicoccales bacterium]|nr:MFS transporter [Puniceicoccales bacterium]
MGAFFFAGFGTFALIYDVQPLLAEFPQEFGVSPATASLALSLTTLALSVSMLVMGRVSERVDRRRLMSGAIVVAGVVSVVSAFAPAWECFLILRALVGVALGGLPAVALAYLADNVPHGRLAAAVGLYVSGTAFGGMSGRLIGGVVAGELGWRYTVWIIGVLCMVAGVVFFVALPKRERRRVGVVEEGEMALRGLLGRFVAQWKDSVLRRLFVVGGVLMGCFVANFNYLCFLLRGEAFGFSQGGVSLVFLMYFAGVVVSPSCGWLVGRFGRKTVLRGAFLLIATGALLGVAGAGGGTGALWFLIGGSILVTIGFFAGHATAGAWVNRQTDSGKAIASAQYLTVYYIGASLLGWAGGWAWQWWGWIGVAMLVGTGALAGVCLVPREDAASGGGRG